LPVITILWKHVEAFNVGYKNWDKVDGRVDIVDILALKVTPATGENWVSYKVKSAKFLKILKIRYLALMEAVR
jgi:hypothetical protein